MDLLQNCIIANGKIITDNIRKIVNIVNENKYEITFLRETTYRYKVENVIWLKNPIRININEKEVWVKNNKDEFVKPNNINAVYLFDNINFKCYAIEFVMSDSLTVRQYFKDSIQIKESAINSRTINIIDYLRQFIELCERKNDKNNNQNEDLEAVRESLQKTYSNLDIDPDSVAAIYLNPEREYNKFSNKHLVFPFGCNSSQLSGVENALSNQISVIEGPPGTGKTQTILNIIANLLLANKSILVVSNNKVVFPLVCLRRVDSSL